MSGVLEGVTVLEMGHVVAIPAAGAIMADWGARVIKIEPLSGDLARGIYNTAPNGTPNKIQWYYQFLNRNKKGVAINLKTQAGRDIVYHMVKDADIFMSNYELSAIEKLGMDYETLRQYNRSIIYAVVTGYGTVGPDKNERGFDYAAAWARSGAMHMMASGRRGIPLPQRGGMMDRFTGSNVVAAVLAALYHKQKTKEGQKIETSLYHNGVWSVSEDIQSVLHGTPLSRHEHKNAPNPLWNNYRCGDAQWVWLAMLQSDLSWEGFCAAIGRVDLVSSVLFNTQIARQANNKQLIKIIEEILATKSLDEWEKIFRQHQVIYGRVQSPEQVINDPQAVINDFFVDLHHPDTNMKVVSTPIKFSPNFSTVKSAAPEIGQNTEEVLLEIGYKWEDIASYKEKLVIL